MQQDINQRELELRQQITDVALSDREAFRTQAVAALGRLQRSDRRLLTKLGTKTVDPYDFLASWDDQLHPLTRRLVAKRSDKTFRTTIKRQLLLSESELDNKINEIIDGRLGEVEATYLDNFYAPHSKNRHAALRLLHEPEQEIIQLLERLTYYTLYKNIARENDIVLVDPHAALLARMHARSRVRRERRKTARLHKKRLAYITRREKELTSIDGGILSAIYKKGWDLPTIIGLRQQYDKRIALLSKKSTVDATKRLAIFEAVTQEFREQYVKKVSTTKTSLEISRRLNSEVDSLLLRIFDLSTVQKNQLFVRSKEYRELIGEKQTLLAKK